MQGIMRHPGHNCKKFIAARAGNIAPNDAFRKRQRASDQLTQEMLGLKEVRRRV